MGLAAETKSFAVAAASFGLAVGVLSIICGRDNSIITIIIAGIFEIITLLIGLIALDVFINRPADSHKLKTLITLYSLRKVTAILFWKTMRAYPQEDFKTQQDKVLKSILELQANTVFGKEHDFASISNRNEYRENVPINSYKDLEPYINRMADDGEENVLTSDKLLGFTSSSGTTGKCKRIPFVDRYMKENMPIMLSVIRVADTRGPKLRLGTLLLLGYKAKVIVSKAGYEVAPLFYHFGRYQKSGMSCSPMEIYREVENEDAGLYCHAVFGFSEREMCEIQPQMATLGHAFWRLCETRYEDICADIAEGSLKRCPNLTPELRPKLESYLKPMPERAHDVRVEFEKGNEGLQLRIWPHCRRATMLVTGGFAGPAKILADSYMKGVFFASMTHSCSEAIVGANLSRDPEVHDYSFVRSASTFFELIPEDKIHDEKPKTVFLDEAEVGKCYEVVLSTTMGLYRYRLGDVVKITGTFLTSPTYEFQYRIGQMLNVYWEKTPENVFYDSVCKAAEELEVTVRDYTACEDFVVRDSISGIELPELKHYVLFIEFTDGRTIPKSSLGKFDAKLKEEFDVYSNLRNSASIGEMTVVQVKPDSFKLVRELLIKETQNLSLKMPRVLRRLDALEILSENRV